VFFATAQALDDRVRELTDAAPDRLTGVVLDLEAVAFIDSQGSEQLSQIHELVETSGVTLRLARVKPPVLAVLQRDGVIDRIGADHVHGNIHRAVEAQRAAESCGQPAT
jgi:anti-anti-sigma factor